MDPGFFSTRSCYRSNQTLYDFWNSLQNLPRTISRKCLTLRPMVFANTSLKTTSFFMIPRHLSNNKYSKVMKRREERKFQHALRSKQFIEILISFPLHPQTTSYPPYTLNTSYRINISLLMFNIKTVTSNYVKVSKYI